MSPVEQSRPAPRVAVCLSGIARNAPQNLRFIRAFLAGIGADVFFHFWATPDAAAVVAALEPKRYAFESQENAPPGPATIRREKFVPPTREKAIASMHYSIGRANALKRAYEQEHGFRYDVVVRMRLDFYSTTSLAELLAYVWRDRAADPTDWERRLYVPHIAHAGGINDQFAIGSSGALDAYAAASEPMAEFAASRYFVSEYYLLRYLLSRALRIRILPFEYVLLRDETITTFELERLIAETRRHWWSGPIPHVAPELTQEFFLAKADSVELVDAYDAETPRVFRLRASRRGYVQFDARSGRLGYAPDGASASLFFVIVAGDADRTKVNIRPRDVVMQGGEVRTSGTGAVNLAPDAEGRIRPDGYADDYSAFVLGRRGGEVTFEWFPGFWTTPDAPRLPDSGAPGARAREIPAPATTRLFLRADADGLVLAPGMAEDSTFALEYVRDPAAEAAPFGLLHPRPSRAADTVLGRLLWLSFRAVRSWEVRGTRHVVARGSSYVRARAGRLLRGRS